MEERNQMELRARPQPIKLAALPLQKKRDTKMRISAEERSRISPCSGEASKTLTLRKPRATQSIEIPTNKVVAENFGRRDVPCHKLNNKPQEIRVKSDGWTCVRGHW